jgi:pilus assembly protein Flp/PilA
MIAFQARIHGALSALRSRLDREEGQALVEYALILALIAVVSIAILQVMGVNVSRIFNKVNTALSGVAP